jgi:hypothetical protein
MIAFEKTIFDAPASVCVCVPLCCIDLFADTDHRCCADSGACGTDQFATCARCGTSENSRTTAAIARSIVAGTQISHNGQPDATTADRAAAVG